MKARTGRRQAEPVAFKGKILADRSRWQRGVQLGDGVKDGRTKCSNSARPGTVIAKSRNCNCRDMDPWMSRRPAPSTATIVSGARRTSGRRRQSRCCGSASPRRCSHIGCRSPRALFLEDDPAMDGEDAAPAHGARGEDADRRLRFCGRLRQQAGAGTVGKLPAAPGVARPEIMRGRYADRHEHQQQEYGHVAFSRAGSGPGGGQFASI